MLVLLDSKCGEEWQGVMQGVISRTDFWEKKDCVHHAWEARLAMKEKLRKPQLSF